MTWHDRKLDGTMIEEIILTRIVSPGCSYTEAIPICGKEHQERLTQLNAEHNTFFVRKTDLVDGFFMTHISWADKQFRPSVAPSIPKIVPTIPIHNQ